MRSGHGDEGLEFKERAFSVAELRLVQEIVADHGRLSRQELANTVCELLDWRRPHGGLLPPGTTEIVVRAGEFTGSWTEVIAQVLRGSGLGYAAASPAPGHAAYLRATAAAQTPSQTSRPARRAAREAPGQSTCRASHRPP